MSSASDLNASPFDDSDGIKNGDQGISRRDAANAEPGDAEVAVPEVVDADVIQPPPLRGRRSWRQLAFTFHGVILAVSIGVLIASFILEVRDDAIAAPLDSMPLPGLCTFKRMTGIDCPGCGLTRCFVSISHGELEQAFSYNAAGLLLYIAVVFQLPFRGWQILRLRRGKPELDFNLIGGVYLLATAVILFGQWIVRYTMA